MTNKHNYFKLDNQPNNFGLLLKGASLDKLPKYKDCFDKCNQLLYCFVEKLSDCPIEKLQNETNPLAQMSMERQETLGKRVAKYYIEDKKLRLGTVVSVDEDDSRRWDKIQYMIRWDDTTYSSLTQNEVCISIDDFRNQTKRFVFKRNKQAKIPKDGIFHNVTLKDPPVKKFLKLLMTGRYAVQEKNDFIIVTWFKSQQKPNLLCWAYIMNVAT